MGLDVDAWYGSSWEPQEQRSLLEESENVLSSQEALEAWLSHTRSLVTPQQTKREGGALVLGRFYPPHLGHALLLQVAQQSVKGPLLAYVFGRSEDWMPVERRRELVQALVTSPGSRVELARDVAMAGSPDQPDFWKAWAQWLRGRGLPEEIRTLFASDRRAQALATELKLDFVLVDPERRTVPISATMIRKDPWAHWRYLHPGAREAFTRSVVLLGPEGAGKTTLSNTLARHYFTSRAPEYVESWASKHPGAIPAPGDFEELARGEREQLETARRSAKKFFVADTDLLSLVLWKRRLHGVDAPSLVTPQQLGDLYLVLDDAPWRGPPARDEPAARRAFVQQCLEEVRARGQKAVLISGPRDQRFWFARQAIADWEQTRPAAWEK